MNAVILAILLAADPTPEALPRAMIGGDETAIVGQIAELTADESLNAKTYKWVIRPKPLSLKNSKPDGSAIFVSHDKPEIFEVELIAASADGQIDIAIGELEIKATAGSAPGAAALSQSPPELAGISATLAALRELHTFTTELQPRPQPTAASFLPQNQLHYPPTTLGMAGQPVQNPGNAVSWPEGVKRMALGVNSASRKEEGIIVSGSFRAVANTIKTGTFSAADPWTAANLHAREALGNSYRFWQPFFGQLLQVTTTARQHGYFATPDACVKELEEAAEVLGAL